MLITILKESIAPTKGGSQIKSGFPGGMSGWIESQQSNYLQNYYLSLHSLALAINKLQVKLILDKLVKIELINYMKWYSLAARKKAKQNLVLH